MCGSGRLKDPNRKKGIPTKPESTRLFHISGEVGKPKFPVRISSPTWKVGEATPAIQHVSSLHKQDL